LSNFNKKIIKNELNFKLMQIFEFQFNPKKRNNLIISFLYEPDKYPEKTMGNLYIVGELNNIVLDEEKILNKLIKIIKQEYYSQNILIKEAIKNSLQKANYFLSEENKISNSKKLENLNLTIIAQQKNKIIATKTGNIYIYLVKYKKINEINGINSNKNKESKPFEKIITTKINNNDKIIISTKDVFEFFDKKRIMSEISKCHFLDKKIMDNFIDPIKNETASLSGIFLLIDIKKTLKNNLKINKEVDFNFNEIIFFIKNLFSKKDKINLNNNSKKTIFLISLLIFILTTQL